MRVESELFFPKSLPGRQILYIDLQSPGLVLFEFVLGIGMTLLNPHISGEIRFCRQALYR